MKEIRADLLQNSKMVYYMQNYKYVADDARRIMQKGTDPMHRWSHIMDVVENTLEILVALPKSTQEFWNLCLTCAYWHDVGRVGNSKYAGKNKGHEELSGIMLKEFLEDSGKWNNDDIETCVISVTYHGYTDVPRNEVNKVLKDADKLGYIGVRRWKECAEARENHQDQDFYNRIAVLEEVILILPESKRLVRTKMTDLVALLYNTILREPKKQKTFKPNT